MTFTIEQIKNYLLSQESRGDIMYNLSEQNIIKANDHILTKFDIECQITIENFIEGVRCGMFSNEDGCGVYGFENSKTKEDIDFLEIDIRNMVDEFEFTHVFWYNK